jgi:hypothetical protein
MRFAQTVFLNKMSYNTKENPLKNQIMQGTYYNLVPLTFFIPFLAVLRTAQNHKKRRKVLSIELYIKKNWFL